MTDEKSKIGFGVTARDKITGLEGVVVGRMQWMYGCVRWGIQPRELKDGKPVEASFFDEEQLELVAQAAPHVERKTGGPSPTPARSAEPRR